MNTEQTGFKKFKANKLRIYEDGYIGSHGWHWGSHTIASFIAKAIQAKHGHNMTDVLELPTAKEIYDAYKHNNAHFSGVEAIKSGYPFTAFGKSKRGIIPVSY